MSDAGVAQARTIIDEYRKASVKEIQNNQELSKEQRELAMRLINDSLDVLGKTIEGKRSDAGLAIVLEPRAPTMVAASVLRRWRKAGEGDPGFGDRDQGRGAGNWQDDQS